MSINFSYRLYYNKIQLRFIITIIFDKKWNEIFIIFASLVEGWGDLMRIRRDKEDASSNGWPFKNNKLEEEETELWLFV